MRNVDKDREWLCEEGDELRDVVLAEDGDIQPGLFQLVLEGLGEGEDGERTGRSVEGLSDKRMK